MIANLRDYTNRDYAALHKGDSLPVKINAALAASGWAGSQFVRWIDDGSGEPCVTLADGRYCGFLPFGSNESGDQYTSITATATTYRSTTMFFGGNIGFSRIFETETYESRHGGPLALQVYSVQRALYVSENGKITTENESDPAVNPGLLFPDGTPITANSFVFFGIVMVPPHATRTNNYLGIQTNFGI